MLIRCIVAALLVRFTTSNCESDVLSDCTRCCSVLFSTSDCDLKQALRLKIDGNGVLGAIWDNAPVVAVVRAGCLLELWDFNNQTERLEGEEAQLPLK
ncbi:hypothetical protein NECAME_12828 [Necator americanus]|uniref:Uncharacterized protein n=1 Tax=Necator americanus TaxID=51031 RepID=W2T120_NECAM|nr:hypothetical protein NECAME_12828 [Necator americanus]ETN74672.1 hypothetical protein NECAME_12828 [Necator americanus]